MGGESEARVAIRRATDADTAAIRAVWAPTAIRSPTVGVDILTPYLAHQLRTERVLVAGRTDRADGFAAIAEISR